MGFSVSGSAAIIFAAMFVGFGMFHSAATNSLESVSDARQDRTDRTLVQQNTELSAASADWNETSDTLTVQLTNTGASQLAVSDVDLLANNSYQRGFTTSVDGDSTTNLWLPGEQLTITVTSLAVDPCRVKVVTGPGVAETASTEVV